MHQHPRPSPRSATPAGNPTTNPERTNNSRDAPPSRSRSSVDLASYTERAGAGSAGMTTRNGDAASDGQDREYSRLNQIIQHFHTKAALMICSSRASLPQTQTKNGDIRQNRWFNVVLDETDVLIDDLDEWRRHDLSEVRPAPLVIEVFLDTSNLTQNQALVVVDESGKRWDVADALASSAESSPAPTRNGARYCEVVLERWTIHLGDPSGYATAELNDALPNVYKKGVVLFRSLYTFLRLIPAWKLYKRLGRPAGSQQALKLKFRVRQGHGLAYGQKDSLFTPLCPAERDQDDVVEHYAFRPLVTRVGPLHCMVDYRKNCALALQDTETLLSNRFLGLDEDFSAIPVGHSLPVERIEQPRDRYSSTAAPAPARQRPRALLGAYGSLGTFHATDKRGSPVSELKQRAIEDEDSDDMDRLDKIRTLEGASRRISTDYLVNPPFKAGSIASSPRPSPSPSSSVGRTESALMRYANAQASSSKRSSLNALPQQQLRAPPIPNEVAVVSPSGSSSPKPAPIRYTSSFANRTRRLTSQSNRTGESNASSGRASSDSKEKSEQLNEGMPEGSGSGRTDDSDDIASFISDLERAKDINPTPASPRDNIVNLAKFSSMRDPSTQLAEEMSSSSLIQTSITPPSRRLSNVPGLSTSSSPSRTNPLGHAPHVRSRLSTHSIVEEATGASAVSAEGSESPNIPERDEDDDEEDEPFIFPQDNIR